jgi:hypothetical protein
VTALRRAAYSWGTERPRCAHPLCRLGAASTLQYPGAPGEPFGRVGSLPRPRLSKRGEFASQQKRGPTTPCTALEAWLHWQIAR